MRKIVVVGQTPPPFGGQAVMIQRMLDGQYEHAKLIHVRMAFSKEMSDMGRFRFGKFFHIFELVLRVMYARIRHGADVLYYPTSGPDFFPMLRDLIVLVPTRWMFRKTIFHFHAAGLSEIYPRLPMVVRLLYRIGYFRPDLAIRLSRFNPEDGKFLQAVREEIVPNGIDDECGEEGTSSVRTEGPCRILFVGLVTESKGILVLLDAMRELVVAGVDARLVVVGKFASDAFREHVLSKVESDGLRASVEFKGVLTGTAKWDAYRDADIFCFPTFFESESFGLVVVEAMQCSVPVVVSRWRGVQSLVEDGRTGLVVPPHDSHAVAVALRRLIDEPALRERLGAAGRREFLEKYTTERFHRRMDECFAEV